MKKTVYQFLLFVLVFSFHAGAQVARLYHNEQAMPVEQLFYYPGCGENPAVLMRKTTDDSIRLDTNRYNFNTVESISRIVPRVSNAGYSHILLWRNMKLELDSNEYVGQVSSSAVYSVKYFSRDSALLVKYGVSGAAIVSLTKKKVKMSDAGGAYIFQPLKLRNAASGWARVPVTGGKSRMSNIEVYDLTFKKLYTMTDTLTYFDVQLIGKDSMLYTMIDTSRHLLRTSIRIKTGVMVKASQLPLNFVVKGFTGVAYSALDTSIAIAINEKPKYAYGSYVIKISFNRRGADQQSYNDEIDFIGSYKGSAVFHAQGAFYAPGKLLFFMNQPDFTMQNTVNVSTILGNQLLFNKDLKANVCYDVDGMFTDVQNKWIAFHVFEYSPKDLSIGKNFIIFCFPDGRNEILEVYTGYGLSIQPTENGKIVVAKGKDVGVFEVK